MRNRYFLFCNDRFGKAFESAFREWCSQNCARDFVVVRSVAQRGGELRKSVIARYWTPLRLELQNHWSLRRHRTVALQDVNDPRMRRYLARKPSENYGIICGFNQIFKQTTIDQFGGVYNFHPSLLPYYRGPVPTYWCIRNHEQFTGITLHAITAEIDRGQILCQGIVRIETDDPDELEIQISRAGVPILVDLLNALHTGNRMAPKTVNSTTVYHHHVDYKSFPR